MQYGLNFPSSNVKSMLEQNEKQQSGVRTWRQLFGGASLGYGAQTDAINADYSSAMAQAYKSNFEQNQAIAGGGLSSGHTNQLLAMSRKELSDTYDTYIRNYSKNMQTAAEDYGTEVSAIDTAMTERADNFKKYIDYAWKYASEELSGSTFGDDRLNYFKEKGLDWMLDDDGQLKTWEEISPLLVDRDTREMTEQGRAYFDAMYNATPQDYLTSKGKKTRGFDQWLADTDEELRDYMANPDVFNYTFDGKNVGTLNTLLGRSGRDQSYEQPEYELMNFTDEVYNTFKDTVKSAGPSIDKIGQQKKQVGKGLLGLTYTYDDWFAKYAKNLAEPTKSDSFTWDSISRQSTEVARAFIADYKTYAKSEYETFTKELETSLGKAYADKFLQEYGTEVSDLYKKVLSTKGVLEYTDFIHRDSYVKVVEENMKRVNELKELGFDKVMAKLYTNLEAFIEKEKGKLATEKLNQSGF